MSIHYLNVVTAINSKSSISKRNIHGADHIVVSGVVPIVDNIVMNGRLYRSDDINRSYHTLNNKPAPYDHPKVNGVYVSATNPVGMNAHHIGAWCENARKVGSKVEVDLMINVDFAKKTAGGVEVLERIEKLNEGGEPIQVSTGLFCQEIEASGVSRNKKYKSIANNLHFDHLAILPPGVPGAGSPADGVGIFAANENETAPIFTVNLSDELSGEPEDKRGILNKLLNFTANSGLPFDKLIEILNEKLTDPAAYISKVYNDKFIFELDGNTFLQKFHVENGTAVFNGEAIRAKVNTEVHIIDKSGVSDVTEEQLKALFAEQNTAISAAFNAKIEWLANENKELKQQLESIKVAINSSKDAEQKIMRDAVKSKFKFSDTVVNSLSDEALREMYAGTKDAVNINPGISNDDDMSMLLNLKDYKPGAA